MKKGTGILCSFLCLCVLFTSTVFTVCAAEVLPESSHPYKNKMDAELMTYRYTGADADRVEALRVKFSSDSRTYDFNDTVFVFGANGYVAAELYGDLLSGAEVIDVESRDARRQLRQVLRVRRLNRRGVEDLDMLRHLHRLLADARSLHHHGGKISGDQGGRNHQCRHVPTFPSCEVLVG